MKQSAKTEMVFSNISPSLLDYHFKRLRQQTGPPGLRLHDLRHTHASLLLLAGANPKVVQERLGHESISTTLDIYAHLIAGMQEKAVQDSEKLLDRATANGTSVAPHPPKKGPSPAA